MEVLGGSVKQARSSPLIASPPVTRRIAERRTGTEVAQLPALLVPWQGAFLKDQVLSVKAIKIISLLRAAREKTLSKHTCACVVSGTLGQSLVWSLRIKCESEQ